VLLRPRDRHRLDRGGDHQLDYALHVIAITRARPIGYDFSLDRFTLTPTSAVT
jgi:hypothetical protein